MLALLVAALVVTASSPMPTSLPQMAVITTSPSTNTAGYRIAIAPDGGADVTVQTAEVIHTRVDPDLAKRLYADLARAGALDALPTGHCMKSTSFGTSTWISYHGANSPDVQCAQNEVERALELDARAIAGAVRTAQGPK